MLFPLIRRTEHCCASHMGATWSGEISLFSRHQVFLIWNSFISCTKGISDTGEVII